MIYADNAATTKMSETVIAQMLPFLHEHYGNASSKHSLGAKVRQAISQSRQQVARAIGADHSEITFTSGGSEANSWVIRGIADSFAGETIHVITSSIEHHSVLNACRALEAIGIEVTYLPVSNNGVVEPHALKAAVKANTKLVSIMLANNEIGSIQPIAEIGSFLNKRGVLFHTDAVQATGHIPVNVKDLNVDFLTASAHKFNGAKGIGFIYIRSGLSLPQLVFGGEQEYGRRAGTENVASIVAMGFAIEESVSNMTVERERLAGLVDVTANGLKTAILGIRINAEKAERLPGILNVTFPNVSGESIMHLLDLKEIYVSTSSACNSGKNEPSHVLLALRLSEQEAKASIRISYGRYNSLQDAKEIVRAVTTAYEKIVDAKTGRRSESNANA